MKSKFNTIIFSVGILIGLLVILLLLMNNFLPNVIIRIIPIVVFALIMLLLFITAIQMLFAKQSIAKFSAIPILLVMFFVAFMMIKMPIYQLLMNALIGEQYDINTEQVFEVMSTGFKFFHIGIWVSITPIVISALWSMKKTTVKIPKNIDDYYPTKAKITSCDFTDMIINNDPVYQLELEIQHYEGAYTISKKIRVKAHTLLSFTQDTFVNVLIDPDRKNRVFIKDNDTIY